MSVTVGWTGYNALYGATTSTVSWYSSNDDVVTVESQSGYILAVGTGSAWITAKTNNGHCAKFYIQVEEFTKTVSTEKAVAGVVINEPLAAQAYRVSLNMTYHITKIKNGKAYVGEISAFTKYDKGNIVFGLNYPDITIGRLTIGEETYTMQPDHRDMLLSPDWEWDAKVIYLNKWYDIGTSVSVLSMLMLDAALVPYRDVELETQIVIS